MSVHPTYSKTAQQFMGNSSPSKMEVHDTKNEKTGCQLDEILRASHAVRFVPDTKDEAHRHGYDNCAHCIGGSAR